jgi:hypothetical protein
VRHRLVYAKDTPLSNLYVSMLDAFGTPVERFADSTGPLRGAAGVMGGNCRQVVCRATR